jgi:hypothetical protein
VALVPPAKRMKSQCDTVVVEKETAAPRKRQTVVPHKKNKSVVESDLDADDDDDVFLELCKKSLKDPIDPFDLNWWAAPAITILSQTRTKLNKGLIKNNYPLTFTVGKASPFYNHSRNRIATKKKATTNTLPWSHI